MTEQPTPTVTPIVTPSMEGTHYGIPVSSLGEDGDLIALGHHDDDKALEAFRAHTGLALDDERITCGWACFYKPQPGSDEWEEEYSWVAEPATADIPGALPVTYLVA